MSSFDSPYDLSRIRAIIPALLLALGIGLAGCSSETPAPRLEGKIRLGAYAGGEAALAWIAKEKKYFEQVGLDVEVVPFSAGKLAADALSGDEVDVITCADFVFVKKSFHEDDLRILGAIAASEALWLTARRDQGILSPTDLTGKRIGVTLGSSAEYYLGRFLSAHGLKFSDIAIVDLPPKKIVDSMLDRSIDAAFTWNPNVYHIQQQLKEDIISFEGQGGQSFYFVLLTREGWLQAHREHAKRFMQALMLAEEWVADHAGEATRLLSDTFRVDQSYLNATWEAGRTKLFFPQALLVAMNGEKRWLIRRRLVDTRESPDLGRFLSPGLMKQVKPHAVTVIK